MAETNGTTTTPATVPAPRRAVPAVQRQELAASEARAVTDTSATAVAAHAKAAIEARYGMAIRFRRDIDDVRQRLLRECQRPGFARVARYRVPRGGKQIEGASIRFAEAAIRIMGNLMVETPTLYDDPLRRIVRVEVTDLETNASYAKDLALEKTVERQVLKAGQQPISQRLNSSNKTVYTVEATEEDFAVKEAANISKAIRTLGLRLLPGDLLEESMQAVLATLHSETAKDPDAERKAIADGFAKVNVAPSHLKLYLGHELSQCSPAELVELRELFTAIRDGHTTWAEVMAAQNAENETAANATASKADKLAGGGTPQNVETTETTAADDEALVEGPAAPCSCPDGPGGLHYKTCPEVGAPPKPPTASGPATGAGLFGRRK